MGRKFLATGAALGLACGLVILYLVALRPPFRAVRFANARSLPTAQVVSDGTFPGLPAAPSAAITVTIHNQAIGKTTTYIGASEAAAFWPEDLADLGINTYRMWTKMAELEWWDDGDYYDDSLWNDSENGSPTIAEIRADSTSGFTQTIPWDWWDERFNEIQAWRYGEQTRHGIISKTVANQIIPVVMLRTYDDQGQPEQRPWAAWAPRPPVSEAFRNEWWEHCFAIAYWLNVRHSYGVTHFQVLNEPDYSGQGWLEYGGTAVDYAQLVLIAHDAISYANSLAGLPVYLHAPVVASYSSPYVSYSLDNADAAIEVVDYHDYAADPLPGILAIQTTVDTHNPDASLEPIWNSEWGALWTSYNSFERAMRTAQQLLTFSEEQVAGVTIFNLYDWSTAAGQDYGLIDLRDDGSGGVLRVPTETYYAYRLMIRGLIGGKERLAITAGGLAANTLLMATRDSERLYLILIRDNVGSAETVTLDLSKIAIVRGTAQVYEYSVTAKDQIVLSPTITAGVLTFTAPANGLALVSVPLNQPPTAGDDQCQVLEDSQANSLTVLDNDSDSTGDPLTIVSVGAPAQGGTAIHNTSVITYSPAPDFIGEELFFYTLSDGALTDTATVSVTVLNVNEAPSLDPVDDQIVAEGSLLTFIAHASDPDPGTLLTFSLAVGAPAGADLDPVSGVFAWIPGEAQGPGVYSLTVRVNDDGAPPLADSQAFTVAVLEVNEAPVLEAIGAQTIEEGSLLAFTAHASDPDPGTLLTFSLAGGAPAGAAIDATSAAFTWIPGEAQGPGIYSLTVQVVDGSIPSLADSQAFTVTVAEVNQPPIAGADSYHTDQDTPLLVPAPGVLHNDGDADLPANPLAASLVEFPAHGVLVLYPDGSFVYTPTLNYAGIDAFTYGLSDGAGVAVTATVTIEVIPAPPYLLYLPLVSTSAPQLRMMPAFTFQKQSGR